MQKKVTLGNLYATRDWGHAKDYAMSMWKTLQYKKPDDWIIATNKKNTVKQFINICATKLDIKLKWIGQGLDEKAINIETKKVVIDLDKKYLRPTEVDYLKGNFSRAKKLLKWKPRHNIDDLINDMLKYEMSKYNNQ